MLMGGSMSTAGSVLFFVPPGRGLRTWSNPGDIRVFFAFRPRVCCPLSLLSRPTLVLLLPFFLPRALLGALLERWSGSVCHGRLLQSAVLYHSSALVGAPTSRSRLLSYLNGGCS